jgi:hypothetical protein
VEELVFNKHDDFDRGLLQGKAQALYAIINLPQELKDLKSLEELEAKRQKEMLREDEDGSEMAEE